MNRGEVWTVAGGGDYTGKPRPAVVVQDDQFDATDSITICAITSVDLDAPLFRVPVQPSTGNGLTAASQIMVDKIASVRRTRLGRRIGRLDDADVLRLNRSIMVFLGLAGSPDDAGAG
ncbi:MAG: type II toxin-antitoxin system PemK/MazF family toxin [Dehalococcoidia bacterium]